MKSKILAWNKALKTSSQPQQWLKLKLHELRNHLQAVCHHHPLINDCLQTAQTIVDNFVFKPESKLSGIFYGLKDNIVTTDQITTGGSLFLKSYFSPFDATVYTLLQKAGAINIGKTNLDEFGLGGTGTYSAYGAVCNPLNPQHLIGGSSSGSAYLVAANLVPFAIGTDTGDSIRKPASYCNIVGYKPSYGAVSRYGVYPFCPSLDTVGIFTTCVADAAIVFSELAWQDQQDCTSWHKNCYDYFANLQLKQPCKIAIFSNVFLQKDDCSFYHNIVHTEFEHLVQTLEQSQAVEVVKIDFNNQYLQSILPMYMVIAYAEAASCYSNLTGMTFGPSLSTKNVFSSFTQNRALLKSQFVKRMVIGAYVLSPINYETVYLKAKAMRTVLQREINAIFAQYDAVILPGAYGIAPTFDQQNQNISHPKNNIDNTLQIANFCGLPSITIPWITINNMPVGLNIFANFQQDKKLLQLAAWFEKTFPIKTCKVAK